MKFSVHTKLAQAGVATGLAVALTTAAALPAGATTVSEVNPSRSVVSLSVTGDSVDQSESKKKAVAWATILTAVLAAGGGADWMGKEAAQRMYYQGLRNAEYQQIKWSMRAMVIGAIGPVFGGIFLVSFENKFYSMV